MVDSRVAASLTVSAQASALSGSRSLTCRAKVMRAVSLCGPDGCFESQVPASLGFSCAQMLMIFTRVSGPGARCSHHSAAAAGSVCSHANPRLSISRVRSHAGCAASTHAAAAAGSCCAQCSTTARRACSLTSSLGTWLIVSSMVCRASSVCTVSIMPRRACARPLALSVRVSHRKAP